MTLFHCQYVHVSKLVLSKGRKPPFHSWPRGRVRLAFTWISQAQGPSWLGHWLSNTCWRSAFPLQLLATPWKISLDQPKGRKQRRSITFQKRSCHCAWGGLSSTFSFGSEGWGAPWATTTCWCFSGCRHLAESCTEITSLGLTTKLKSRYGFPHFVDEESEAQRV